MKVTCTLSPDLNEAFEILRKRYRYRTASEYIKALIWADIQNPGVADHEKINRMLALAPHERDKVDAQMLEAVKKPLSAADLANGNYQIAPEPPRPLWDKNRTTPASVAEVNNLLAKFYDVMDIWSKDTHGEAPIDPDTSGLDDRPYRRILQ